MGGGYEERRAGRWLKGSNSHVPDTKATTDTCIAGHGEGDKDALFAAAPRRFWELTRLVCALLTSLPLSRVAVAIAIAGEVDRDAL